MGKLYESLTTNLLDIHPVTWAERHIVISGVPSFRIRDTGRDYLLEPYEYLAFIAPDERALPVIIVKSRKVEMSTTISVLALYYMTSGMFTGIRGLHAFPFVDQSHSYSNAYFDPIVRKSGLMVHKDPMGTYSVTHKQFTDGNQLFIEGASTEGKRLRSMTLDFTFFDEVQDMTRQALDNTREAMTHSVFGKPGLGMEVSLGTPSFEGSNFDVMWGESDQRYFHLRCSFCDEYFIITLEVCIKGYDVRCPKCKRESDKRESVKRGKWIATRHHNVIRRGYHFSQLMVPYITIESILHKQNTMGSVHFMNEVLGEFCSGGTSTMTFQEILSKVKEDDVGFREHIFPTESRQYLGVDWGSRTSEEETGSWTAIVILTPLGERRFRVEYCQLVTEETQLQEKVDLIESLWRKFSVVGACADMGYGHNEVAALQRLFGDRLRGVWSSPNVKKTYTYDINAYLLTINRDSVLTEVFELIRQGSLRVPFQDPPSVEWLVRHLASMNVETATVQGMTRLRYRKTSKPCDGLMALMYAYLAYRFDETQAFRNVHADSERRTFPKPRVAHIPSGRGVAWQAAQVLERKFGSIR